MILLTWLAWSAPLGNLPVQGVLTGPDGDPLQGTHSVRFVLAVGGAPVLDETKVVSADLGLFSIRLGGAGGLDLATLGGDGAMTLTVAVDGGATSAALPIDWAPRAAYAARSGSAANADALGGQGIAYFATSAAVSAVESAVSALQSGLSAVQTSLSALDARQASDTEAVLDLIGDVEANVNDLTARLDGVELSNAGFVGANCVEGSYVIGFGPDGAMKCTPAGLGFTKITSGATHSCAILSDESVRCWGSGGDGRLGNKVTANYNNPVSVKTATGVLKDVIALDAGCSFNCAVVRSAPGVASGTVWCWGLGTSGQLGNGANTT